MILNRKQRYTRLPLLERSFFSTATLFWNFKIIRSKYYKTSFLLFNQINCITVGLAILISANVSAGKGQVYWLF